MRERSTKSPRLPPPYSTSFRGGGFFEAMQEHEEELTGMKIDRGAR